MLDPDPETSTPSNNARAASPHRKRSSSVTHPDNSSGNTPDQQESTGSQAYDTKAWLEQYTPWTAHTIDLDDPADNPRGFTLPEIFWNGVRDYSTRTAFSFFNRSSTYERFGTEVATAAAALQGLGVRPGDTVALVLPNCPQALIAFYAVQTLGAIPTLHNPLYTAKELEHPFQDHAAKVAFFWDKSADVAEKMRLNSPVETIIAVTLMDEMPWPLRQALKLPVPALKKARAKLSGPAPAALAWTEFMKRGEDKAGQIRADGLAYAQTTSGQKIEAQDPALILYTSGTTGQPKGAVLTHRNLIANLRQGLAWVKGLGTGPKPEVMLAALPIFHAYGLTMNITMAPLIGGHLQLLPAPEMDLVMKVMKKNMPTWMPGVPTLYEKIMETADEQDISISGIRASFSGASALPASTVEKWERLTGGKIVEGYGLTETAPIIVGNPMGRGREGYIGVPFPSTEVRIADPNDPDVTMPDGEAGELLVRGPQVFKGYLNKPDATASAFHGEWFRTGDMAVMEPDGFIKIVSRIKEMIITGGFNVYPAEVEEVLCEHPSIDQASVVGIERGDGSETVVAAVVLADGATVDTAEFREFAAERLTRYKVPRRFHAFRELPADQLGKVRRREVQELVEKTERES
ncbi:long-chain fatty acid--CoA ligase [Corynebacterium sp. 320]|uniref:long-chain-fatty-acid--CoA ligase n=1 Tax=Corynebacterium TaxID=1716 RepID=UPI00125CB108|nr:long-chain fatty acid--CoA ligase [Corynebacterium sp. 320]KAB1550516.1 long-chain fatty acid--CoA ligase [Corynebacterium sp. 319]KAB1554756.1 long-chain fatty acid--CoA ligase [Corynebacterium sp. 321]KAB3526409.1 long-chain fatty acid--CoA ligase [Corynebacterium sp. 250]KAB3537752.1 long-chain fatty acid--CoA ligase [Corynebacterium sp. 366]QNP92335.1 long-chain fatty acid--CoA ligase [Corynebacterium zhongnanshanii]